MTYLWLCLPFVAAAALAAAIVRRRLHWGALILTATILLVLTAVFDNIMIAADFFHYAEDHLVGLGVGLAPVEDFAYPVAGALLLPALWHLITRGPGSAQGDTDTLRQVVLSSRPASWINTAFPFAAAYLFATGDLDWVLIAGALFFLIPYNLAMYGINDVFDYASDLHNPRKGGVEGALLAPRVHRTVLLSATAATVPFIVALLVAGGVATSVWLTISLFAVVAYSAPVLRFKERPVLDSLTSSTHFVSPAVVGFALAADRTGFSPSATTVTILAAFFLWGMAAHAFGAVQDVVPDREGGIASVATVFGARSTVRLAVLLWAGSGVTMIFTPWPGPLAAIVAVPYLVISAPWWSVTDESSHRVNASWRRFMWLNYTGGFVVTMLLIASWPH